MHNLCCAPPFVSDAEKLTEATYLEVFHRIENLALNVMRWDNLPKEVSQLVLERFLFYYGACAFFHDDELDQYLALPLCARYAWNEYGLPTEYEAMGFMGYRRRLNYDNSVLIYNNYQLSPDVTMAGIFASRIAHTKRVTDVNVNGHTVSKILAVPENKKRSAKSLLQRIKNFELWTVTSEDFLRDVNNIKEINAERSYIVDKLDLHESELWRECYEYFGIDSTPNKSERVITDEISVQTSVAEVNRNVRLNPRQDACERIKEMFDIDVTVTANLDSIRGNGGDRDVKLYDGVKNRFGGTDGEDETD